MLNKQVVMVTL